MNVVCLALVCLSGNVYQDFFEQGSSAYIENRLDDAIQAYGQLHSSGIKSGPVYYNLASAYYHAGDIGNAVLNYERALAVEPDFAPASRGLDAIASTYPPLSDLPPGYRSTLGVGFSWSRFLSVTLLMTFWWFLWGILLINLWRRTAVARRLLIVAAGGVVLMFAIVYNFENAPEPGVVLAVELPLRYGPDERDALRIRLKSGDRICVDKFDGDWARVETENGVRGWVEHVHLGAVNPPFRK